MIYEQNCTCFTEGILSSFSCTEGASEDCQEYFQKWLMTKYKVADKSDWEDDEMVKHIVWIR